MNSSTTKAFWKAFEALPAEVQINARKQYALWQEDRHHPSLQFKRIHDRLWSIRIGSHHRSLAVELDNGSFNWFWIGTHAEYDRLIRS